LVAVAHGSKDPRAAAATHALLGAVRDRAPGLDVRTAFLDHAAPSLPQVLGSVAAERSRCVVVPLLLASAYHAKADIPGQAAKIRSAYPGLDVVVTDTLGPHPALLAALDRRLGEAWHGPRARASVVLAAAGSSDPAANAANAALAAQLKDLGGWRRVVTAYASAAAPSPAEAVTALAPDGPVVVATYLLAPGYFADKIRAASLDAGAAAVSDPLGAAPEVADLIISRYRSKSLFCRTDHRVSPVTSVPHTG
jgi:sirohydrochlorin ferrochelatase